MRAGGHLLSVHYSPLRLLHEMSSHARALLDELFLDIFTCLVHDHTTLLACARVCWAWRRELAPTIFETITLKPADDGSLAALASFVHTAVFKLSYSPAQGALLARLPRVRAARVEGVTFDAFADLQLLATGAGARLRSLDVARCTFRAAPPWNANWHAPPWRNYVQRAHPALDSLRVELCEERAPLHYLVYASPSLHTLRCLAVSASRDYLHHIVLLAQHPECRLEVLDLTVVGLDAPLEGEGNFFLNSPLLSSLALRTSTASGNPFVLTAIATCQLPRLLRLAAELVLPSAAELDRHRTLLLSSPGLGDDDHWLKGCFSSLDMLDVTFAGHITPNRGDLAAQEECVRHYKGFFHRRCQLIEPRPQSSYHSLLR